MEPELATDPALHGVLEALRQREPIFHRPEFGRTRLDFERMTAETFWEIGASGRRYSREYVLQILDERLAHPADDPWETSDFHCAELGPATYLLTYTLRQSQRLSRRSTIWRRNDDQWQIVFHQGTLVADG